MTSIPVGISRHSENKFKRLYLKKERVFFDFLLHFWNVHEIWDILKIKNFLQILCRFSDNNFKRLYLKKERLFVDFWLYFWNVHEIYNVLKNKKGIPV